MKTLKELSNELGIKKHTLYRRLLKLKRSNLNQEITVRKGNTDYLTDTGINLLMQELKENPVNVDNVNEKSVNDTVNASSNINETLHNESNVNRNESHYNFNVNQRYNEDDINELLTLRHDNELLRIKLDAKEIEIKSLKRELKRLEENIEDIKQSRDAIFGIFGKAVNANSRLTNEYQKPEDDYNEIEPEEIRIVENKKATGNKKSKKKKNRKKKNKK